MCELSELGSAVRAGNYRSFFLQSIFRRADGTASQKPETKRVDCLFLSKLGYLKDWRLGPNLAYFISTWMSFVSFGVLFNFINMTLTIHPT